MSICIVFVYVYVIVVIFHNIGILFTYIMW